MRTKVTLVVLFVLLSKSLTAQWAPNYPQGSYDTTLGSRIQAAMQVTYNKTLPYEQHGVAASVIVPGLPQWSGAVGTEDDSQPLTPSQSFEIASCTKTFITALIMQLEDSGKLSIHDPLSKYLPEYPNVDPQITIKQLLEHSSGIYDYLNDDSSFSIFIDAYFTNPSKHWTVEEILLNYVKTRKFTAGADYKYSNTDFLLLGLIAEMAAGDTLSEELHRRFIEPLGLTHTSCGWDDPIPTNFPHNYTAADSLTPSNDYFSSDKTAQLSMASFAGGIVSTPADLARWSDALYSGRLLSRQAMVEMLSINHWSSGIDYGLGVVRVPYGSKRFYGHDGSLPGFHTMMFTNSTDSVTVVVYMNSDMDPADVSLNDYVLAILGEVYRKPAGVTTEVGRTEQLVSAYPNPFSMQTTISFRQDIPGVSSLVLYDDLGRAVRTLRDRSENLGEHAFALTRGELRSGTYYYVVNLPGGRKVGNLVIE